MQQGGSIELKYEIPDELLKATPLSVSDVKFILEEQEEKNLGSSSRWDFLLVFFFSGRN